MTSLMIPSVLQTKEERILWATLWARGPKGRRGVPIVLVGDPGTAKTSKIARIARLAGLPFEAMIASLRQPNDFLGLPSLSTMSDDQKARLGIAPEAEGLSTTYAPPDFVVRAAQHKWMMILLDEFSTSPPSVQAALLRPLFEGVVGDVPLPKQTRWLLAMNEVDDAAGGYDISLPLANRVGWMPWHSPDATEFVNYIMAGGGNAEDVQPVTTPEDMEDAVDQVWPAVWGCCAGELAGFLRARPSAHHSKPANTAQGRAWPSSRSWENALCALAACRAFNLAPEECFEAVGMFVGHGAAKEFEKWVMAGDLPNPQSILDGSVRWAHDPRRLDLTAAVLTGITSMTIQMVGKAGAVAIETGQTCHPWIVKVWDTLHALPDDALDLSLGSVQLMRTNKLLHTVPSAYKMLQRIHPMLQALNMTLPGQP